MMSFAERLRFLRRERELSLDMLVNDMRDRFPDIQINKSMVSRWESGKNDPTLQHAKYISMYFNVSLDYLIGLTDTRTPSRLLAYKKKIEEMKP